LNRTLRWATYGLTLLIIGLGALAIQPGIAGLFHDDGIYLSVARSLAEGHGYRLGNLPGSPLQTKYPFLYSGLLSILWRIVPPFPASIPFLKATSVFSLGAIALLSARWYARRVGDLESWQLVFVFLVCLNPMVLPFVDYTLTELPFMALCLAALCIGESFPSGMDPETPSSLQQRSTLLLAVTVGAAFLLRQAAAPLILGGAVLFVRSRRYDLLTRYASVVSLAVLPWLLFKWMANGPAVSPLLSYYLGYEPSVVELATRGGSASLRVVGDNLWYLANTLDRVLLLRAAPSLRVLVYPLVFWGLARHVACPVGLLHWFAAGYLALLVLWPWHPGRYLLPLLPLMPLGLILGTRELWKLVDHTIAPHWGRLLGRAVVTAPLATVVLLSLGWTSAFLHRSDAVRLWFVADSEYGWEGFEETFAWVRDNTGPTDVLATALDPVYYLYTNRQAVRPWFHQPWTYFYPIEHPNPRIGSAAEVQAALEDLGVRYLIVDPLTGYVEKDAAYELFRALLERYTGPEFDGDPNLRFVSSDTLHRVYELPRRVASAENAPP